MPQVHAFSTPQIKALVFGFLKKGASYAPGFRTGGAYRRMCERLAADEYLGEHPPFPITVKGLVALRELAAGQSRRRYAKLLNIKDIDDELATVGII
jgi:hypothetical protein